MLENITENISQKIDFLAFWFFWGFSHEIIIELFFVTPYRITCSFVLKLSGWYLFFERSKIVQELPRKSKVEKFDVFVLFWEIFKRNFSVVYSEKPSSSNLMDIVTHRKSFNLYKTCIKNWNLEIMLILIFFSFRGQPKSPKIRTKHMARNKFISIDFLGRTPSIWVWHWIMAVFGGKWTNCTQLLIFPSHEEIWAENKNLVECY